MGGLDAELVRASGFGFHFEGGETEGAAGPGSKKFDVSDGGRGGRRGGADAGAELAG